MPKALSNLTLLNYSGLIKLVPPLLINELALRLNNHILLKY